MHEAAKRGNIAMIEEMLTLGFSVNGLDKAGNTSLHWACRNGQLEAAKLIMTKNPVITQVLANDFEVN
jgi:ankyrin repeat protein